MTQLLPILGLGFLLGLRHALDADHVVAVTAIISRSGSIRQASWAGILWGSGHTVTLFIVAAVVLIFKFTIPEPVVLTLEIAVGVMLILLGCNVLRQVWQGKIHWHSHKHDGMNAHSHLHSHAKTREHRHGHVSFGMGLVHGLAGSGALVLLALSSASTVYTGMLFVLIFGLGSILGMLVTTTLLALPLHKAVNSARVHRTIVITSGCASIVVGGLIIHELGPLLLGTF